MPVQATRRAMPHSIATHGERARIRGMETGATASATSAARPMPDRHGECLP